MRSWLNDPRALLIFAVYALVVGLVLLFVLRGAPDSVVSALESEQPPASSVDSGKPLTFTVELGMSGSAIATALEEEGVITDRRRLEVLLNFTGGGDDLEAGCYVFNARTPAAEVARRLREGITANQLLVVPEGRRVEEIGRSLQEAGIATPEQWQAALDNAPRDRLPEPPPEGSTLNGYLFPATYPVQCTANAEEMVASMIDAFAQQVTPELIGQAQSTGLTLHEVLTLASIVEREAVLREEQPIIASVFLNRLAEGMPLQADPTVQYAVASANPPQGDDTWWKTDLTEQDLAIDSPYNTYLHPGLPPGPIANPGIDAIRAVIEPAQTDFLYFVATGDGTGSHAFAATLAEHNANVERFQR